MYKVIELNGEQKKLVSNALLPRLYRSHFGRDMLVDFRKFKEDVDKGGDDSMDTSIYERLTWLMLKQGGNDVGNTLEEWLESIDFLELYSYIGVVCSLLEESQKRTSIPKKK